MFEKMFKNSYPKNDHCQFRAKVPSKKKLLEMPFSVINRLPVLKNIVYLYVVYSVIHKNVPSKKSIVIV